jgi:hypothetical protein
MGQAGWIDDLRGKVGQVPDFYGEMLVPGNRHSRKRLA